MITYEASVVCDGCKAAVAGTARTDSIDALWSAKSSASYKGWKLKIGCHLCPTCQKPKQTPPCQPQESV